MSKIIVVDTREDFLSEVAVCCKSLQAEFIPIADPAELGNHAVTLRDAVVVLWADCPPRTGVNVPQMILRAITASRLSIPVILYTSNKEGLTNLLEPGLQYPTMMLTAHACSVAGAIKRVIRQQQNIQKRKTAFEDWAYQNQVSVAGTPGRVSVFVDNQQGGFTTLGEPQDPLRAVGCLLQSPHTAEAREPVFY